jgi:exosome complex component CSL4
MSKKAEREKKEVFPGDKLGVIEEFIEGKGAYKKNGVVRSEELGITEYDILDHVVEVEKITPKLIILNEGDEVIAEVGSVARRDARVDIFMVNKIEVFPSFGGVIHISDISKNYVKNIDSAMRNGDIIKAKVVNVKNRLNQLSLEGGDYGVIYAYCSRCGSLLEKKGNRLSCLKCNRTERRQTARNYGEEVLV